MTGSKDDPHVELNSFIVDTSVCPQPAADAYERLLAAAATVSEETQVKLKPGEMLMMLNFRTTHGRTPYTASWAGNDRWLQRFWMWEDE